MVFISRRNELRSAVGVSALLRLIEDFTTMLAALDGFASVSWCQC